MTTQNDQEYFPKLSLVELQFYAHGWAALYPNIQKICLFRGLPDEKVPSYVFIIFVPPFESYLEQKPASAEDPEYFKKQQHFLTMIEPYNRSNEGCGHIKDLQKFYLGNPPENYKDEWFWFNIAPEEDIFEYQIVQPPYFWLLYKRPPEQAYSGPKKGKPGRPPSPYISKVREVASKLWKIDPSITIADMVLRNEIVAACDGEVRPERTIRGWLDGLPANRSPGRRPRRSQTS